MLDVPFIRQNLDAVKQNCVNRNVKADVDRVVCLDDRRKQIITQKQQIEQQRNAHNERVKKEKDPEKKAALIAEGRQLGEQMREQIAELDRQVTQVEEELRPVLLSLPNMTHPAAPVGHTAE